MAEPAGRTALVAGGNRGIGAAVAINYRERGEDAERNRQRILDAGGRAATFQADVSRSVDVARRQPLAGIRNRIGPKSSPST
jgi:NAD(P)-dependent dehydrogenase (short-subunit alcohol dehydrogenase family)